MVKTPLLEDMNQEEQILVAMLTSKVLLLGLNNAAFLGRTKIQWHNPLNMRGHTFKTSPEINFILRMYQRIFLAAFPYASLLVASILF
jgi:hypothetical protein